MPKTKPIKYVGQTIHPGGRTIEIFSEYQPWLSYAVNAITAHDDLMAALKKARGFCSASLEGAANRYDPAAETLKVIDAALNKVKT